MKKKKHKRRIYKRISFWFFMILLISVISSFSLVWFKYSDELKSYITTGYEISNNIDKHTISSDKPTIFYDKDGNEIKRINTYADYQVTNDNINPYLKKGFVAVEDKRFYNHHGVDLYGTSRSIIRKIMGGSLQGGSTITQQLVKNKILKNQEQTYSRKISEMVVAQELEKKYTKDEILISYLNSSWFGNGATGVGAAAQVYFNKNQKDLTVRESAVIIGLTNNPTHYDPITNPENSKIKTETILNTMYEQKIIDKKTLEEAYKEKTVITKSQIFNFKDFTDNYAISYAMHSAAEDLARANGFNFKYKFNSDQEYKEYHKKYNESIQESIDKISSGGYDIYTSIDMNLQNKIQNTVSERLDAFQDRNPENNKLNLQVATTIIDNNTHNVAAIIGGRTTDNDYFNRAYQGFSQPGSTSKPIIAYAPAMMYANLLPQTTLRDSQVKEFPNVKDWFGSWYNRDVTAREALEKSLNAPALRASLMSDVNSVTDLLAEMEFSNLHPYDNNNIISIGGFTYGVNTTEMASAYSTLENNGKYVRPSNVNRLVDTYNNETVYENEHIEKQVYSPSASYMTLDMMKTSAVGETITAKPAIATNYPENLQAAKTGTTDNAKDVYFVEVTSYYSSAVWIGRDDNNLLNENEKNMAMLVNGVINNVLLEGKPAKDFDMPDSISKKGDNFTRLKDDNNEAELKKDNSIELSRRNSIKELNNERLSTEDYRIIYGLTKKQEIEREKIILDKLDEINSIDFNSTKQYKNIQKKISEANNLLTDIKSQSAKAELTKRIETLQNNIAETYSSFKIQEANQKNQEKNNKLESAKNNLNQKNQEEIDKLLPQIPILTNKIENLYKSNGDYKSEINNLDKVINQLNSLGRSTPYYNIITDGNSFTWEEKDQPTVTFQEK